MHLQEGVETLLKSYWTQQDVIGCTLYGAIRSRAQLVRLAKVRTGSDLAAASAAKLS